MTNGFRTTCLVTVLLLAPAIPPAPAAESASADTVVRSIAITFDDAPRPATGYLSGPERAGKLIAALQAAGVHQAVFFCNTARFDGEGLERIAAYSKAGHLIGNHSHSHQDLHRVGVQAFIADYQRASKILQSHPNARKWFRFPYLHEGTTPDERDAVRAEMSRTGYRSGYVTIDNFDWYMEALFQDAIKAGLTVNFDRLRDAYVAVLTEGIEFYDGIARQYLGRSPAHVLLLHENDLAALFLDDLVMSLRDKGWRVIAPDEAYADPIAAVEPRTLQLGQGRVVALAVDDGYAGPKFKWENQAALEAELLRRGAWNRR
jgi:peptidoglycan/xylan/chitin deacetylase (PgdA/CDA1 family)